MPSEALQSPPKMAMFQHVCLPLMAVLAVLSRGAVSFSVPAAKFSSVYSSAADGGAAAAPDESSAVGGKEYLPQALIFDCDGVLADTERDGHRPAFNAAFKIKNLGKGVFMDCAIYHERRRVLRYGCPVG